jgi:hypothetical protein
MAQFTLDELFRIRVLVNMIKPSIAAADRNWIMRGFLKIMSNYPFIYIV